MASRYISRLAGLGLGAAFAVSLSQQSMAYEAGSFASTTQPGVTIGASAGAPPPGIYMVNQFFADFNNFVGPGSPPGNAHVGAAVDVQAFVFVPGWSFLGATYDAVIAQPFILVGVGGLPGGGGAAFWGVFNTYIVPIELSWNLGNGFFIKTGLGIYADDGTVQGPTGLSNVGQPFWVFQPEIAISYLGGGWNLTAFFYEEFHTANTITGYTNGDVFHADFTATKTFGKWILGPVAYYVAQVTPDSDPNPGLAGPILTNSYDIWAVGGLIGYDFGPATFTFWLTDTVASSVSGPGAAANITTGWVAFFTLSYALWNPEAPPTPKAPLIYK